MRKLRRAWLLVPLVLLSWCADASAYGPPYAPLDRPGPPLSVPAATLRAALSCGGTVSGAHRPPILLVPGTNLDPGSNYAWNYERALTRLGWPYCTITLPNHTMGDIQIAGEYIVYALRTMSAMADRKVDILGFSQGGMVPRWALRFWPDTRPLVDDFVALDPSNHGTVDANFLCHVACPPADWQQASTSNFIAALNSDAETFAGIDYTVVYSRLDEVVVPNGDASGSSSLHTGAGRIANIRVQDICPGDLSEHLAMGSYDPVGYALAVDAFSHPGPADLRRIGPTVCSQPFQPGVDPATFVSDYAAYAGAVATAQVQAPEVPAEPPLRCYVFAACPMTPSAARTGPRRASPHRGHRRRHRAHRPRVPRRHRVTHRGDRRPDWRR